MRWFAAFLISLSFAVSAAMTGDQMIVHKSDMKWGPGPDSLPAGAQAAVLSGDPSKDGDFAIRLKMPAGYKIAPHTHPADEQVTLIEGSAMLGMGEAVDQKSMQPMKAGDYVNLKANMAHYVSAKGVAIVEIHSRGPFMVNYINAADDPRQKKQ